MNIIISAKNTAALLDRCKPIHDPKGLSANHALWMLQGISLGYVQHEKAHRWLGYAQAILVVGKVATMNDMKLINKRSDNRGSTE